MLESLYTKTFLILGSQLIITWVATIFVIRFVTKLYYAKTLGISATKNEDGLLDLEIDWVTIKP